MAGLSSSFPKERFTIFKHVYVCVGCVAVKAGTPRGLERVSDLLELEYKQL